ncbi:MAG: CBS domain-containing protein [Desulfobacteraceae bacterium]|nr:MAG: CBS domain-containing protein [Desulfobacteraceae bacterium]
MLVKYWMSRDVVTVSPEDSMKCAMDLIKRNQIRQLLVMAKDGQLKGMLSDGDLKRASASDATTLDIHELIYLLDKVKVADIMSQPVITVPIDYTIEEAAEMLQKHKISSMPVLAADGSVRGIITRSDLFRALVSLTGLHDRGLHIALMLEDRPGSIMEVANLVRQIGGKMASILTSYNRCPEGYRRVYLRIYNIDRSRIDTLLDQIVGTAKLLYMVDHRENRREIFSE